MSKNSPNGVSQEWLTLTAHTCFIAHFSQFFATNGILSNLAVHEESLPGGLFKGEGHITHINCQNLCPKTCIRGSNKIPD